MTGHLLMGGKVILQEDSSFLHLPADSFGMTGHLLKGEEREGDPSPKSIVIPSTARNLPKQLPHPGILLSVLFFRASGVFSIFFDNFYLSFNFQ
jgi:hypothetical protein